MRTELIPRLLVIDDNSVDRMQIRRLLGKGYLVEEAETAKEGLKKARELTPECVLLDQRLPDAEGLELLQEIQAYPVVLLTGFGSTDMAIEALKRGACDFLSKEELTAQRLLSAIQGAIARRGLERRVQAAERLEVVGRLAGGVAHDFNNMLTVILGHVELALGKSTGAEKHLHTIQLAAERSAELTRRLLAFGRKLDLHPERLEVAPVVEEVAYLIRSAVGERIAVEFDTRQAGGGVACFDPGQLQQALVNLAFNARDAMTSGGLLTITVRALAGSGDPGSAIPRGDWVRIAVRDSGCGIPRELQSRVFEPFFTTKAEGVGTGLGLSGVHGFVHQSGGEILLTSEVGVGTEVSIYLPRIEAAPDPRADSDRKASTNAGSERVLIVEDEPLVRELMSEILSDAGFEVTAAEGRDQAVACAAAAPGSFHLVLSDVVLPGHSGPEVVAEVLQHSPQARVIYTSGYTASQLDAEGTSTADAFLSKPVSVRDLLRTVRSVLDQA